MRGVYITSTLAQRHMDTDKNVGFVVRYKAEGGGDLVRRNTRALDSGAGSDEEPQQHVKEEAGRFLAFKALPPRSNVSSKDTPDSPDSEIEVVKSVCDEIVRVANKSGNKWNVPETAQEGLDYDGQNRQLAVEEKDIISLANAKKTTGYLEQIEYSLKKLVWG
jgi:hypothetical protein